MTIKLGSLFDGIGGFPLAATKYGLTPVWASEIEPFPIAVTKKHFPNMKHLGDITKINGAEIEPVDVITFGSPCQDLSVAGKGAGMGSSCLDCGHAWTYNSTYGIDSCPECLSDNVESTRSGLFMEAIRVIREMREATNGVYPQFSVWENVPGAFSSNGGNDFKTVLSEISESEIPMPGSGGWATAGRVRGGATEIAWRVLDAQYWGVPQRRKRIFLVADFTGQRAAEILFKPESLSRYIAESESQREGITRSTQDCIRTAGGCLTPGLPQRVRVYSQDGICPTLQAEDGRGNGVPSICVPSIGFKSNASIADNAPALAELTPTLQTTSQMAVCAAFKHGNSSAAHGIGYEEEVSPTLTTGGSNAVPAVCIPIHDKATRHSGGGATRNNDGAGNGLGVGKPGDPLPTLTAGDRHAVYCTVAQCLTTGTGRRYDPGAETLLTVVTVDCRNLCENDEISGTLQSKSGGGYSLNYQNPIRIGYAVRRLTPVECLRLQGFPDWWFYSIPGNSDTACYKAAGNGMAQPCPDYVIENIATVLDRNRGGQEA